MAERRWQEPVEKRVQIEYARWFQYPSPNKLPRIHSATTKYTKGNYLAKVGLLVRSLG